MRKITILSVVLASACVAAPAMAQVEQAAPAMAQEEQAGERTERAVLSMEQLDSVKGGGGLLKNVRLCNNRCVVLEIDEIEIL